MSFDPPHAAGADAIAAAVDAVRAQTPLVHCLTNSVVQEITANALLAAGAAPAMIPDPGEAAAFAAVASGVLVNLGTLTTTQLAAQRAAVAAAGEAGVPWVLDPVAIGALELRTDAAREFAAASPAAIRGNASEITALAGLGAGGRGVDTTTSVEDAADSARELAARSGAVVAVSGPRDLILAPGTSPSAAPGGADTTGLWVESGHPLLQQVVGTGCALGALVAAYLSAARTVGVDDLHAVAAAHAHAGAAGSRAGTVASGPGSFAVAWLDALADLDGAAVVDAVELAVAHPQEER